MSAMNRPLVGRPFLAGIRQAVASPIQNWIPSPRLGKNSDAAGSQNAEQLRSCCLKIQMMQDRIAPHSVKGAIGKRQAFPIRLHEIDIDLVGSGSLSGFVQVTPRQIKGGDAGASPIVMTNRLDEPLATPSALDPAGAGFSVVRETNSALAGAGGRRR